MKLPAMAAIGLLTVMTARGQNAGADDATALVRAMRVDELILEASKSALVQARDEGHITPAHYACFQKLPASAFTSDLGKFLLGQLTRDEIVDALAFYRSQPGIKFVDFTVVNLAKEAGDSFTLRPTTSDAATPDEMKVAQAFTQTSAGRKLLLDRLVMMAPESREISKRIVGKQLTSCGVDIPR